MDDAWQAKRAPTWRPLPPPAPPPPAAAVEALVAGSSNQVDMNSRPMFCSFVAQEACLQEQSMVQEPLVHNTLNLGPQRLGKTELDTSVLAFLSGHAHHPRSGFMHSPSSTSAEPRFHAQDDGATVYGSNTSATVTGVSSSSEIYGNPTSGNGQMFPFVSSRPLLVSTNNRSPVLNNTIQIGDYCCLGSDSAQPVLHQVIQANDDKRLPASSMKHSWHNVSDTADTALQHTLHIRTSKKSPMEVKSATSGHASAASSRRPRVFCVNTVGELFVSDMGLLGVMCLCHSSNMSVAKFCEHSGSSLANAGDAVHMENGMTLAQWCKLNFGLRAAGNCNGWDWTASSSAKGGLHGLNCGNLPHLPKNPGSYQSIEAFMGFGRSGEPWNNSAHNNQAYHGAADSYGVGKSINSVKNTAHQWNISSQPDFLKSFSTLQSPIPASANNHSVWAMKGSPIMISFEALNSNVNKGEQNVGHDLVGDNFHQTSRRGNHSIIYPCPDAKKSSNQNDNISWGNFPSKHIMVEGNASSSNTELRLGQPSQNNTTLFASIPVAKHLQQFREAFDSQKQQLPKPLTHKTICPRETSKHRPNVQCALPEPSTLDGRNLLQTSGNYNASSSAEAEGNVANATKNSTISLFLSHLNYIEENNLSKFTDNIPNNTQNIMTRELDDDCLFSKCSLPDSFRVITNATEKESINETKISDDREKRKGLKIAGRSPYNGLKPNYFSENKQTTVSTVLPSIIASDYPHGSSMGDRKSTMYFHQEFGPDAWNGAPYCGKSDHRGHITCRSANSVPCFSARPCSLNAKAPKNHSTINPVFGSESTPALSNMKDRDKTQHLMDENLEFLALRCTADLSKQEKLTPSLETSHQHGRMCCLSSADLQRSACKGDIITSGGLMHLPYCNIQQNASEISARSVRSCSKCECSSGDRSSVTCTNKCPRCIATKERTVLCSKDHGIQRPGCRPGCHICHPDRNPLLRLGGTSNDNAKQDVCSQKERSSYFPGKCGYPVVSSCLTGCCISEDYRSYAFKQLGVCGEGINVALPSYNDHILKDSKIENFGRCECSKRHLMKNDFQAAIWRDVPSKVTTHCDATLIDKPAHVLEVTSVVNQPAEKRFAKTCPERESVKEHLMSSACSESSAPAVTEVSIEISKVDFCAEEVGNAKSVSEYAADEGSGIGKCGSSDEALESRDWEEALSLSNKVDLVIGDHKLQNIAKVEDTKNQLISTGCKDQEQVNHMQHLRRVCRAEKQKGPTKWRRLDASTLISDFSTLNSDSPGSVGHPHSSKGIKTPRQPDKQIKRNRSVISSKSLISKRSKSHHKFCDYGEAQLNGDCSDKVTELSTLVKVNQDFVVDVNKQPVIQKDKQVSSGKPPKYMSLGCIKMLPTHGVDTCDEKVRPVVSGNLGIISDVLGTEQKPPKMVSLSVILKTAQRCCLSENEVNPKLLSFSEAKKVQPNAKTMRNNALSSWKKGENGDSSVSLRNRKKTCFLHMPGINKISFDNDDRCADEVSVVKRKRDCGSMRTSIQGDCHEYVKSQPGHEETRKLSLSELTGEDKHGTKSTSISRNGENSNVIEGGSSPKAYSSICTRVNLVGRNSHCEKLSDCEPPSNKLLNDPQAYQDDEQCPINRRSSKRRRCRPFVFDSDTFCCVCGISNKEDGNYLLECNHCLIRVHQACYGVPKAPKGRWYCRPCKTNAKDVVCVLCGYKGGAMTRAIKSQNIVKSLLKALKIDKEPKSMTSVPSFKLLEDESPEQSLLRRASECIESSSVLPMGSATSGDFQGVTMKMDLQSRPNINGQTDSSLSNFQSYSSLTAGVLDSSVTQWVHMVCGLWTPGTRCPNVDTMGAFDVSGTSPARKNAGCSICNRPGGSCIRCRILNCSVHFHPWCAHQKGLLQSEIEGVNNEKVGFYGRCMLHAPNNSSVVGCSVVAELESPRQKDFSCARIEGYKGRRRGEECRVNFQKPCNDSGGCIVSQVQINAWIHINGHKSCTRGVVKSSCSDVECDFRKEYMRYKQAKGWRHLVVYKSGIHALGLYTSQFIARGAMVVEYVGEIVGIRVADKREIEYQSGSKIQYKSACYFFRIDKEHIIDATRKGGIARFVNHSCLPNCVAKVISVRNEKKVVFFAERDINPGEEITYDYHFNHEDEGQKIACFCNSINCRRYLN